MKMGNSRETLSILLKSGPKKITSLKRTQKNKTFTAIDPKYKKPS